MSTSLPPSHFQPRWLPHDLQNRVLAQVAAPMPRGRGTLVYRTLPPFMDCAMVDGKLHLFFVAYYPYATVIKRAIALRQAANVRLTFVGCCIRQDADILRWFDAAYEVEDYHELHRLLRASRPAAAHVTVPLGVLGAVAMDALDNTAVLLDIVDSALFQEGDMAHPDARLEQALLSRSSGLVHKLSMAGVARLLDMYGVDVPQWQVHSLPWRPLFQEATPDPDALPRLVYCGGLMPRRIALERGFGHHVFDPLIESLGHQAADDHPSGKPGPSHQAAEDLDPRGQWPGSQRLELAIHVNQNARNMYWKEQQGYVEMAARLPQFQIHKGVPFQELPAVIAGASFGLLYDNLAMTSHKRELFRFNVSSKIFSYFEAGLPVLIYKEFEYMLELFERFGLGVVYGLNDLQALPSRVQSADMPLLRENVRRFRDRFELSGTAPALLEAFGLSARPGVVLSPVEIL